LTSQIISESHHVDDYWHDQGVKLTMIDTLVWYWAIWTRCDSILSSTDFTVLYL